MSFLPPVLPPLDKSMNSNLSSLHEGKCNYVVLPYDLIMIWGLKTLFHLIFKKSNVSLWLKRDEKSQKWELLKRKCLRRGFG